MSKLGAKLQKGLLWSVIQVFIKRVFDFFVKLVLINILFPEDFGIVGIAAALTGISYVISDFGLQFALVQRKKKDLLDTHYQSVFWWNLFWAIVVFATIYFIITPFAAQFYNEPLLLKIIPVLSLPILINGLALIYWVKMLRDLDFKKIGIISSIATIIASFIGLIIALKGGGLWGLVIYIVLPYVISLPFLFLLVPWRPKLSFSSKNLKQILNFSIYTFFTSLILVLTLNINHLFIGKLISTESLGIYSIAFMLTILLSSQVTSMIDRVMFPFYSKIQADISIIKKFFLKSLQYYALILFPIMLTLLILGASLIKLFFGFKWMEAKTPMRILALVVMINLLTHGCTIIYRSIGKPKLEMKILTFVLLVIMIPAVYLGSFYGIIGVSFGVLVTALFNLVISLYFLKKELNISLFDILLALKPSIVAFGVTATLLIPLYLFAGLNLLMHLTILFFVYGFIINYFYKNEIKELKKKYLQ